MSEEYVPWTEDVRGVYAYDDAYGGGTDHEKAAAFDRWLSEVVRQAKEDAWYECERAQLEYAESVRAEWPWNPYRRGE